MHDAIRGKPITGSSMEVLRRFSKRTLSRLTKLWPAGSRLFTITDIDSWSIGWDIRAIRRIAKLLGIRTASPFWLHLSQGQAVFYGSQFFLLSNSCLNSQHRIATAYFHGKPGCGIKEFDLLYGRIKRFHHLISRVQVSHSEMHHLLLDTGIAPEKVFRIPIGIQLDFFPMKTDESRRNSRKKLQIPENAVVVGSFQKDGVGWSEGEHPKWIKGPDVLLKVIKILKDRIPGLFLLLSGPARGYIKKGLEKLGIPYIHRNLKHYPQIRWFYHALDLYLVTSRQEGGPKSVLESMACGIPLVTTRVGQAMDLVRHGINGFMVDVEDVEGLAHYSQKALMNPSEINSLLQQARETAEENSYINQLPLWKLFMKGFVKSGDEFPD